MSPLSSFFDLHHKRTPIEAFVVYIVAFLGTAFLGALVAAIATIFIPGAGTIENGYQMGILVGTIVACMCSALLSFLVIWKKRMLPQPEMWALGVLAAVLGYFGGALLGMIIPAIITTKTPKR